MLALAGVGLFYLSIFAIGLWASRNRQANSVSEVLVAGRRIPLWIGILTMTATWVDGGYLNGTAEAVYGKGLIWAQAPWGFGLSLLLGGFFFAPLMHRQGFLTLLDPFQQRYGNRMGALLYLPAMCGELLWTAGILAALGTTFGVLLHLDFRVAIVLSASMTVAYTVRGGLWSIAYTDVAQLILAASGMLLCLPFVFAQLPPLDQVFQLYGARFGNGSQELLNPGWWDAMLLLIFGGIPWHCYFQRVLSSPSPRVAQQLSLAAALLCCLMAIPPALLGIAGAVFDWQAAGLAAPAGDFVILPTVLRDLTPRWVGLIGLCAVAGAIMSSVDASIYSVSTMFSWNIVQQCFRPEGEEPDPNAVAHLTQRMIVVFGTLATLLALHVQSIYSLWFLSADLVYVLLFPQLLVVLFDPRANRWGVGAGLLVGLLLRVAAGEPGLGLPAWVELPAGLPHRSLAMLAGLATTLWVSRLPLPGGASRPVGWVTQRINC